jgi:hypothetical protein
VFNEIQGKLCGTLLLIKIRFVSLEFCVFRYLKYRLCLLRVGSFTTISVLDANVDELERIWKEKGVNYLLTTRHPLSAKLRRQAAVALSV